MQLLASGRIEVAAVHDLPETLDLGGILAGDHRAALLHGVLTAAFPDAGDALIGLDGDDVEALIEQGFREGLRKDRFCIKKQDRNEACPVDGSKENRLITRAAR